MLVKTILALFNRNPSLPKKTRRLSSASLKEEQEINNSLQEMVEGIEKLKTTLVKEVFVPRTDTIFLSLSMQSQEIMSEIKDSGHSRYPVYGKDVDDIIGVLYTKDLLAYFLEHRSFNEVSASLPNLVRKAFIVPESKSISSLLREFRLKHIHLAVCVDEYGGISGIICLEDILELIVGDIQDEYDEESDDIVLLENSVYLCSTRVGIDEFNQTLKVDIPDENYDTLGGFVLFLFGHVPVQFEKTRYQNLTFIVQEVDSHKIKTIKVIVDPPKGTKDNAQV